MSANEFLKEKSIIKEGYSKWICRFEDGQEFNIGDLIEEYSQQENAALREINNILLEDNKRLNLVLKEIYSKEEENIKLKEALKLHEKDLYQYQQTLIARHYNHTTIMSVKESLSKIIDEITELVIKCRQ